MVWWEWDISFLSLLVYCKFPFMFLFINISKKGSFVWLFCIVNWILLLSWFNIDSNLVLFNFCSIRVFFHIHWPFTGHQGKGKGGDHSDTYLQLCMWDDYNAFSMATLVYTRLLLDKIYHLVELPFDWLIDWLITNAMFVYFLSWWFDSRLLLQQFDTRNRWIWTRIDYYPCITSEAATQVC